MPISMQTGLHNANTILHAVKIENLPAEIFELQQALLAPDPSFNQVTQILSKNPELLGEFLYSCNRILKRNEENLILNARAAINILGLKEIEELFLASYLAKNLPISESDYTIIKRCKRAALAATELAYWIDEITPSDAYLITFMQDVGAIYLSRYHDPFICEHLEEQCSLPFSAYRREAFHYQTAHTYIGSLIAKHWRLGDLLCKSILLHHTTPLDKLADYDLKISKMVALIQLANSLVTEVFAEHYQTPELIESQQQAIEFLKMPKQGINNAIEALKHHGTRT